MCIEKIQSAPYGVAYKNFFSDPRMVKSLLEGFVQKDFIQDLDFSEMYSVYCRNIPADMQEYQNDVVWSIGWKNGKNILLHLIFETQRPDIPGSVPLHICAYTYMLLLDLLKQGCIETEDSLPPVFPIVIYTGSQQWPTSLEEQKMTAHISNDFKAYIPKQGYWLVDQNSIPKEQLAPETNLFAKLVLINRAQSLKEICSQLESLIAATKGTFYTKLRQDFMSWIPVILKEKFSLGIDISNVNSLDELHAMLVENIDSWKGIYRLKEEEEA